MNTQITVEDITHALEPLIRRVVREELALLVAKEPSVFYLHPDTPLHQDMGTILKQKKEGKIKLHSHQEVWSE